MSVFKRLVQFVLYGIDLIKLVGFEIYLDVVMRPTAFAKSLVSLFGGGLFKFDSSSGFLVRNVFIRCKHTVYLRTVFGKVRCIYLCPEGAVQPQPPK